MDKSITDYMRYIYKEIIQPRIGDFFEVNAALPENTTSNIHESIDEHDTTTCFCCQQKTAQLTQSAGRKKQRSKPLIFASVE